MAKRRNSLYKWSPEKVQELCGYLEVGHTRRDAQILSDISHETFNRWMHEKAGFTEEIEKAEIKAKGRCLTIIHGAAPKNWTAAAWFLERKFKDEFAIRREVTGKDGGAVIVGWAEDDAGAQVPELGDSADAL